jgi:hypothetical protein
MNRKRLRLVFILVVIVRVLVAHAQSREPQHPGMPFSGNQQFPRGLGTLPIAFEANLGQIRKDAKFVSRGLSYSAYLTAEGMVLSLKPNSQRETTAAAHDRTLKPPTILQFNLLGSAANPPAVGEMQLPGRVNYFLGQDPRRWRTNVPLYSRVRYKGVYPGIDLVYYGNAQHLEYDFEVSPGANPNLIRFEVKGAKQLDLDANGDLVLKTNAGELHFQCPVIYQKKNGRQLPVEGSFTIENSTHVSFHVGPYDANQRLVIDPVLLYSTYLGGDGSDEPHGIAVDSSGSIYLAGSTTSTDLPGMSKLPNLPGVSAFVAKFDPTGSTLIYEDYWGGLDDTNFAHALALDAARNVYVTGTTSANDFPTTVNAYQNTLKGNETGFLTKISADGSSLLYSTYFGGSDFDWPTSIALDSLGDVYLAGSTSSQDLPTFNAYQSSVSPNQNGQYGWYGFVTKFSADLSALAYSTYVGGNSMVQQNCYNGPCWFAPVNYINGLALDGAGNAYVAGITDTDNFPVSAEAYLTVASSNSNAPGVGFVSKFNASGGLDYSTYLFGSGGAQTDIQAITVDSSGSAYVTGQTLSDGTFPITSTAICDPSVYGANCGYAFVTKLDPTGSTLAYSTFLGPNNLAAGYAIALDSSNNAYVLSMTQSGSYATVNGVQNFEDITTTDLLLVEIDSTASTQLFATYLGGGTGDEYPAGIIVDASGDIYVGGETFSTDFPTTTGALQTTLNMAPDAFVLKVGPTAAAAVAAAPATLEYASQAIGSTSPAATTLLRNMGSAPLLISSISTVGDFSESDNCGTSVGPAGSCTISVLFSPAAPGVRGGAVRIQSNAVGPSPQVIPLNGYASGPWASVDHSSFSFPATSVGRSSQVLSLTVTNAGDSALSVKGIQVSGDFSQSNRCPATLAAGSACSISLAFTPTAAGPRTGTLAIASNAAGSPLNVSLAGEATDFTLNSLQPRVTVSSGSIAAFSVNVSPVGGAFNNPIELACSGQPSYSLCSVTPSSAIPPLTLLVSVDTAASRATLSQWPLIPALPAMLLSLGALGLMGIRATAGQRKTVSLRLSMAMAVMGLLILSGCAAPGVRIPAGISAPGTYSITVTATSGTLRHSLPLTLTVQ